MKKSFGKRSSIGLVLAIALSISVIPTTNAQAAVVSFNCPTGGGTYQVNNGAVTGTTGTCRGDLTLDSSVTSLSTYAFGDNLLTSLTIPATVLTITGSTFGGYGSQALTSITVDGSNPNFSSQDGVLFNKAKTELLVYPGNKSGTTYTIPSSVTSVRYYGFAGSQNLTSIDIPNTVTTLGGQIFLEAKLLSIVNIGTGLTSLGNQAFAWIPTLTAINVDPSNASFASIDGVLYNKNISKLWSYPANKPGTTFTSANTVTSTDISAFAGAKNLLTVNLSSITTLMGQEFQNATSVREVIFGNSLTTLKTQALFGASGLKRLTLGTGLTTIESYAFYDTPRLSCVIYAGSNSTIQNYAYPNGVVPVASSSSCLADPAFSLSKSEILAIKGSEISGYTITSTGGAISSYSISPSIAYTPGLSFSTSTGLISGTPTGDVIARTYTISAINLAETVTRTIRIAPLPVPFLSTATTPKLNFKDGKLICTPGTHNTGFTLNGVVDVSSVTSFTPTTYTYNLLINGVTQTSPAVTSSNTASWSMPMATTGSLISCSVSVSGNSLSSIDMSTDNSAAVTTERSSQSKAISEANNAYKAALKVNAKAYPKALTANRTQWTKEIDAIRSNYYLTIDRIKASDSSKMISDATTAFNVMVAAKAKSNADYAKSKQESLASKTAADKAALDAKTAAIAKANAVYGTFIESIGFGVLAP